MDCQRGRLSGAGRHAQAVSFFHNGQVLPVRTRLATGKASIQIPAWHMPSVYPYFQCGRFSPVTDAFSSGSRLTAAARTGVRSGGFSSRSRKDKKTQASEVIRSGLFCVCGQGSRGFHPCLTCIPASLNFFRRMRHGVIPPAVARRETSQVRAMWGS